MRVLSFGLAAMVFFGATAMAWASANDSLDEARALIEAEDFEHAVPVLKAIPQDTPTMAARVDCLLGRIYLSLGKPAKALEFFEHASFTTLDDSEASLGLAEANLALGALGQARHHAETAIKSDPDLVGGQLILALIDQRLGRADAAMARLSRLERDRPDSEEVAIVLARYSVQTDAPAAAIRLAAFVRKNPAAAGALDQLAQIEWGMGRSVEAVHHRVQAARIYAQRGQAGRLQAVETWLETVDPDGALLRGETAAPQPTAPQPETAPLQPPPTQVALPEVKGIVATVLPHPDPLPFAPGSSIMTGSGIVMEGGRQIITNRHVVEDMTRFAVRNGTGHVRTAHVVRISSDDDLALLEIDQPFPDGSALPFADLVEPAPGRSAIVMGFPLINILGDEQPALTEGIVAKTLGFDNDPNTFQMTTKINKGNSGGPVFDRRGRLIGVAVAKLDVAGIFEKRGILVEDMNLGIKGGRILQFLGRSGANAPAGPEMNLEDLYQVMLPRVVLIAGQK